MQEKSPVFASRLEDAPRHGHQDDGLARAKLAVFISGGGSNFKAIHAGCKKNTIHGDVAYVVSDKPGMVLAFQIAFRFLCLCFFY